MTNSDSESVSKNGNNRLNNWTPLGIETNPRILRRNRRQKALHGFFSKTNMLNLGLLLFLFFGLFSINYFFFTPTAGQGADLISFLSSTAPTIDGVVEPNEYATSYSYQNGLITVYTQHDGEYIYFAVVCQTSGWCAIGFNDPREASAMPGSDIKMGIVFENGTTIVYNKHATGYSAPVEDPTSNIEEFSGSYDGTYTTIEFSIKFNAGDPETDKILLLNSEYTLLFATGPDRNPMSYHSSNKDKISFFISSEEK